MSKRRPSRRDAGTATILVYGATGYTGNLTARAALARGLRPILAGRNARRLVPLAEELGLEYRVAQLPDRADLTRMLRGIDVLINTAGPFSLTWSPLVSASLECGVHYLDLASDVRVVEAIRAYGAQARQKGLVLLPAVGFEVVPSDCLAAHVAAKQAGASRLRIGLSGLELISAGSARTMASLINQPLLVSRAGRLTPMAAGSLERAFDYGSGPAASVAVSWADLVTAFTTTGIGDIETYFEATPMVRAAVTAHRLAGPLLSAPIAQSMLQLIAASVPAGPTAVERSTRSAVIVAEAEHPSGSVARARLRTPEAYGFSADTAVALAAEVAVGNYEPGFQTPASLYGADFILRFAGVTREDL